MDKQSLIALAERVEAAPGPNFALEWEIHCRNGMDGVGMYGKHPNYTASLDAAMTLKPKWPVRQIHFNAPCADDRSWNVQIHGGKEGEKYITAFAATPALALTAACLRGLAA